MSRAAGVRDERLLAAIARLPRAMFVPAELAAEAYSMSRSESVTGR
ncbi:MAG: hypothetical protein ACYCXW_13970 [Solirubrobacteraceae bacterium]